MKRWLAVLLLMGTAGCFTVPATSSPVKGTEIGVIVHNYALAFRDFLLTQNSAGFVTSPLLSPLPITGAEWTADDVTSPTPVSTTVDGAAQTSSVTCAPTLCAREVKRVFRDDLRLDQTVLIWYQRGATTTATDDRILGLKASTRFMEQMVSLTETTAPTAGTPWTVTSQYGFAPTDIRRSFKRVLTYAELTSTATPLKGTLDFATKEGSSRADYTTTADGWTYQQNVAYDTFRNLKSALVSASSAGERLAAKQALAYANGFAYDPLVLAGKSDTWRATGASLIGGALTAERTVKGWKRTIVFPADQRFKSLTDQGTYVSMSNRGTFKRTIVGQHGTVRIEGTYRQRVPGVWELSATSNAGITLQFTLRSLELGDAFQGVWSQPDSRAASPDTASFTVTTLPDLTSRMLYTFDRSDTPFTPDESGTLRFLPDTRGTARVSVVKEVAGSVERHSDYDLRVVAEGQKTN